MKALVIGATGAVGKDLVDLLLKDDSFESVSVFVSRPPSSGKGATVSGKRPG